MSIGRDSLSYWTSQVANFALSFVTSVFIAVILGPDGRGIFTALLLANAFSVNLTNLGLQQIAMYFAGKEPEHIARLHTLILILLAGIVAVDFALLAIFGDTLRRAIFQTIFNTLGSSTSGRLFTLVLAVLPFSFYIFAAQGLLTGLGRVQALSRYLFYYSVAANAANLAALGMLPWEWHIGALVVIWTASQVIGALTLFIMLGRSTPRWKSIPIGQALSQLVRLLGYGLRVYVGAIAGFLINRVDHLFILASPLGEAGLGLYGLSAKLAELFYHPSAALENAGYRAIVREDRREAARLVQDFFRMNVLVCGTGMMLMVLFARPFVLFFYHDQFADSILPLRILLPGAFLLACSRMLALFFSAQLGKPLIPSAVAWLTLAINLPLLRWVVFDKGYGLAGAACVTAGCYAFILICFLVIFAILTRLYNPLDYFVPQRRDFERIGKLLRSVRTNKRI